MSQKSCDPQPESGSTDTANLPTAATNSPSSVVSLGGLSWNKCGYCHGKRANLAPSATSDGSSHMYATFASKLSVQTYQDLIEYGWRRSGRILYKPQNADCCCPQITIRANVADFVSSKSQRKLYRKMESVLSPNTIGRSNSHTLDNSIDGAGSSPNKKRPRKPTVKDDSISQSSPTSQYDKFFKQIGLYTFLQDTTRTVLRETIPQEYQDSFRDIQTIYKIFASPLHTNHTIRINDGTISSDRRMVVLRTSVCAAVAGRSINALNRSTLAKQLTKGLKQKFATDQHALSALVTDVQCHDKSGQVMVHVDIPDVKATTTGLHESNSNDTVAGNKLSCHSKLNNDNDHQVTTDSPIRYTLEKWWNDELQLLGKDATKYHVATPWPGYDCCDLTIDTVKPHVSALDPAVHRLYFHYQHVVHNDPDPYSSMRASSKPISDSSTKELRQQEAHAKRKRDGGNNGNSKLNQDHGMDVDDTASSSNDHIMDSSGENCDEASVDEDNFHQGDAYSNEIEVDDDESEGSMDWGVYAPREWKGKARIMMTALYGHLPISRHERIEKAFGKFHDFLVDNPFSENNTGISSLYGTFHQHYRVGGMLIAVGVVDILPTGLSSVYLFYNPSFAHKLIPLGKYATLCELKYAKSFFAQVRDQQCYYYMGYYIHSCIKMRYKAEYRPSELLCPETYKWVDSEHAKKTIDHESPHHNYCRLYNIRSVDASDNETRTDETKSRLVTSKVAPRVIDSVAGDGSVTTDLDVPYRIESTTTPSKEVINKVAMEVGAGTLVYVPMLPPSGQNMVLPLLKPFVEQAGPMTASKICVDFR